MTESLGAALAPLLRKGDVVALRGDLGCGKTTFSRGLLRGLGFKGRVASPTYTLAAHYDTNPPVEHFDAYLGEKERAFMIEGGAELMGGDGVSLVEWPERIEDCLPADRLEVTFDHGRGENDRTIAWHGTGPRGSELAEAWTRGGVEAEVPAR